MSDTIYCDATTTDAWGFVWQCTAIVNDGHSQTEHTAAWSQPVGTEEFVPAIRWPLEVPTEVVVVDREPSCVGPECASFKYDPRCCRFPKSCSATIPQVEPEKEWIERNTA